MRGSARSSAQAGQRVQPQPLEAEAAAFYQAAHHLGGEDLVLRGLVGHAGGGVDADAEQPLAHLVDLARVEPGPDPQPLAARGIAQQARRPQRLSGNRELRQHAVAQHLDHAPAELCDDALRLGVVRLQQALPGGIAAALLLCGGVHDVGEENGREAPRRGVDHTAGEELLDGGEDLVGGFVFEERDVGVGVELHVASAGNLLAEVTPVGRGVVPVTPGVEHQGGNPKLGEPRSEIESDDALPEGLEGRRAGCRPQEVRHLGAPLVGSVGEAGPGQAPAEVGKVVVEASEELVPAGEGLGRPGGGVGIPEVADQALEEDQVGNPLRVLQGVENRDRRTLGEAQERHPLGAELRAHGLHVGDLIGDSEGLGAAVGETGAALVEARHPTKAPEALDEAGEGRKALVEGHVGDGAGNEEQGRLSASRDAIRDRDVTRLDVSRIRHDAALLAAMARQRPPVARYAPHWTRAMRLTGPSLHRFRPLP
jgi:hypothetical protein